MQNPSMPSDGYLSFLPIKRKRFDGQQSLQSVFLGHGHSMSFLDAESPQHSNEEEAE